MAKKRSQADLEKLDIASLVKLLLQAFEKIQELETELEKLKRKQARQAAPFSRNIPKENPKRPGRIAGQGKFSYKTAPQATEITKVVEVPLAQQSCPKCGLELEVSPSAIRVAYNLEMPKVMAQITEYRLEQKVCSGCGITITAQHPRVSPDQRGASAFRVSPELMSLAHVLQYQMGITAQKVPAVLDLSLGLRMTQSSLTQAAIRNSLENKPMGEAYKALRTAVGQSEQVNTDDTSWRTNGIASYLMTVVTRDSVVFQIRQTHTAKQVLELIPSNYQGIMGTDRFKSYNSHLFNDVKQQKCLFHIIKNLKQELEKLKGRGRDYPLELQRLFKAALKLHQRYRKQEFKLEEYQKRGQVLIRQITKQLLARKILLCVSSERIRVGLEYHHGRGNLLRFLENPDIHPTNNGAERALRHNVIFRKLCGGSKTDSGARALEAYSSIIQTAKIRGQKPLDVLTALYSKRE